MKEPQLGYLRLFLIKKDGLIFFPTLIFSFYVRNFRDF